VLGCTFTPDRHAGFDLPAVEGHHQVGNDWIFGFSRTFRYLNAVVIAIGELGGIQSFRKGPDLVYFKEHGIGGTHIDALPQPFNIGNKQVVSHYLHVQRPGQFGESFEVFLVQRILHGRHGILVGQPAIEFYQCVPVIGLAIQFIDILFAIEP